MKERDNIIAITFSGIMSFLFLLASPLHPWNGYDTATDSAVFKTVAMMMRKGYMPYKDSFDHKGPLLYLINLLGDQISHYRGVWVVEFIFMIITIFMLYKIARLSCGLEEALITVILSLTILHSFFEGGNLVEEYAMCFIAISLFIFIDYFKYNRVTRIRLIICGATFGATLLLRPNMIPLWGVMCLIILIKSFMAKDWKKIGYFVLYFSIGALLIIAPIMLWLIVTDDFSYFWNAYIVFNIEYSSNASFNEIWENVCSYSNHPIFLTIFFSQVYLLKSENKWLNISHMFCMIATLISISFSRTVYGHYGMVLIPLLVYPISGIFNEIDKIKERDVKRVISMLISICLLISLIMPAWEDTIFNLADAYTSRNEEKISIITQNVTDFIKENTTDYDHISVYGNWDLIYVLTDREHATKYSYQFPIGDVRPEIMEEYMMQLEEEKPPVIVIQAGHLDNNIRDFLDENKYELSWAEDGNDLSGALVYTK